MPPTLPSWRMPPTVRGRWRLYVPCTPEVARLAEANGRRDEGVLQELKRWCDPRGRAIGTSMRSLATTVGRLVRGICQRAPRGTQWTRSLWRAVRHYDPPSDLTETLRPITQSEYFPSDLSRSRESRAGYRVAHKLESTPTGVASQASVHTASLTANRESSADRVSV